MVQDQLEGAYTIDLLKSEVFTRYLSHPERLRDVYALHKPDLIVIDEVQKLPSLLDEVHGLIEAHGVCFLLTGSSARKLKRGGGNLLAGRAWVTYLYPLVYKELGTDFDLIKVINRGTLPQVYPSDHYEKELDAYVNLYLREEVLAESLTRSVKNFAQFLDLIGLSNGCEINMDSLARDCGVSPSTVQNYLDILEDTLVGYRLAAWTKTKKRKAISRSKFYMFDVGVANQLGNIGNIKPGSKQFGINFEHFIIHEVRAWKTYTDRTDRLTYWRSTSGFEVDLIVGNTMAIEIKATQNIQDKHLKGLRALKEEGQIETYILVCLDPEPRITHDKIHIMPYESFLNQLYAQRRSDARAC